MAICLLLPSSSHFGVSSKTSVISTCNFICPSIVWIFFGLFGGGGFFGFCLLLVWAFIFFYPLTHSWVWELYVKDCMANQIYSCLLSLVSFNKTIFLQVGEPWYYFQEPGFSFRWTLIKINSLSFLITSIAWKYGDWFFFFFFLSFPLLFHVMKNVILLMKDKMNGECTYTCVCDSIKSLMKVEASLLIKFNWVVFNEILLFCSIIAVLVIFGDIRLIECYLYLLLSRNG